MSDGNDPYKELKRIFHEPKRMAIMSALCAAEGGLPFTELKKICDLSDGNLNRHLKALSESGAVEIKKSFVGVKPRTTIYLTEAGLGSFEEYLRALSEVLSDALRAMPARSVDGKGAVSAGLSEKAGVAG